MSLEIKKIKTTTINCNFCGESNTGTLSFIAGLYGNICSSCVRICVDILVSKADESPKCADRNMDKENATQTQ
ncbi:ClpX C4-type zinc finger protein [Xenorhabdus sp. XENO-10]|uniref:ClpX C4-type zinc finger protein n=1 Tax=Xenorhabdus yunnanensis TaxID=3025878 RepID=A0ABT5LIT0_9GAMM|nr:ClpX C4-type zinc finger protein [Xenorhabdus yunnanensis]MDC9591027.1 ClpX C4-type zinc finger protein [Xenorhabdus yunnanensis]